VAACRWLLDNRGGAPPSYVLLEEGTRLMRISDRMKRMAVFLFFDREGERRPAGTGFLVGWPVPDHPEFPHSMMLTAKHVIAGIDQYSDDKKVWMRLNTEGGGATWFESRTEQWLDLTSGVDCVALPWWPEGPTHGLEITQWHLHEGVATKEEMDREGLGIGDEVFMVGLFRNHVGRDRNEPIIRVGNIAALPADPIHTRAFGNMRAILIEARSIGGLSGSPVFVHMGFQRVEGGRVKTYDGERPFRLLGLIHGHWDAMETEPDMAEAVPWAGEKVNMGIAIVTPIEEVLNVLGPFLDDTAKEIAKSLDEKDAPTEDSVTTSRTEYDRFEELARKLVHTPKAEVDEKRKES
jgi:hypothetical protein